ncbi:TPA: deoxyribose-phosphate aldolase [Candidatus Galligastranaerophilus intestinavium]|uniref:Deoxyribose-phosphate aldolase n=1 Tax=Candidatus Galligastranaerophilus intestinavium TaxID=2840836 RepID=A0A9D1FJP8_9BACT|nr:deoxyribose-phosphate aldolase [Candidatus Galligastranaerophilus intestinavium]
MELAKYIEHTLLKPTATAEEVEKLVEEAVKYGFFGVCINPVYVRLAKNIAKGTNVKIVTVVNFPLGANVIDTTLVQTHQALSDGADEIDTVINLGALKEGDYKKVTDDIKATKNICSNNNLKVILETDLLTNDEIKKACLACVSGGADFVKTSTGFVKNGLGARTDFVRLMAQTVERRGMGVKASGGIKTRFQAKELIEAGATRLGTSSGVAIVSPQKQ